MQRNMNYPAFHTRLKNTRRFELEALRRIPVNVSPEAQGLIDRSSAEGRRFPLALSEVFGVHSHIKEIDVEAVSKSTHFVLAPHEEDDAMLLRITIKHVDPAIEDGMKLINADDLNQIHPSGLFGFHAAHTAHELLRLHVMERGLPHAPQPGES
jgi:hypothetical protein